MFLNQYESEQIIKLLYTLKVCKIISHRLKISKLQFMTLINNILRGKIKKNPINKGFLAYLM